jgi:phosphoribosylformimino-5-aminoimidazole carboxamide ribotide isomerase
MASPHSLQVVPVIDLLRGHVVRAVRGERAGYRPVVSTLVEGCAPEFVARALLARAPPPAGRPAVLYVADLDALQGGAAQIDALRGLLALRPEFELWLDAGFQDAAAADALARAVGTATQRLRPVFGSESIGSRAALAAIGTRPQAILSLDRRHARPLDAAGCWETPGLWPPTVIVMTLDRVGSGAGPDLETFAQARAQAPDRTWIGAGGVRVEADLQAAAAAGADAWLVASALHDGTLAAG